MVRNRTGKKYIMERNRTAPVSLWVITIIALLVALAALILGIILAVVKQTKPEDPPIIIVKNVPLKQNQDLTKDEPAAGNENYYVKDTNNGNAYQYKRKPHIIIEKEEE